MHCAAFRGARNHPKSDRQRNVHAPEESGNRSPSCGRIRHDSVSGKSLRFESPVQFTARVLKEDIEVCGQPFARDGPSNACSARRIAIRSNSKSRTDWT